MKLHRPSRIAAHLVASLVIAITSGCTKLYEIRVGPNSHYVPPDATVRELGPVKASLTHGASILFFPDPDLKTAEFENQVFDLALKGQVGANVIINYGLVARIRTIPMFFSWGELEVEGTGGQIIAADTPSGHRRQ